MDISTEDVKKLRNQTGVSVMACKKALEEAGGDMDKAVTILQQKSKDSARKKQDRELGAGIVESYIHTTGTVGVLIELSCESDFVAKNEEFKKLAYDIAMHIAASSPRYLSESEITEEERSSVQETFQKDFADKPAQALEGKIQSYFKEQTLLDQPYIKDPDHSIKDLVESAIQKFGERVEVARFQRYEVGVE